MINPRILAKLSWQAAVNWSNDNVPRLGASLAYYTLFSVAPVLIVAIAIGGFVFGADAVRGQIVQQLDGLLGKDGAGAVQLLLEGASKHSTGTIAIVVGSVTFFLAAVGAFLELQHALNTVFRVKVDPAKSQIKAFLTSRLRAFSIVLAIGFLLVVSLTVNAALSAAATWAGSWNVGGLVVWRVLNVVASLTVVTILFALIYRFLPDVQLEWRDIWVGASVTSVLFVVGKELIGAYLGGSSWTSSYGAVGSILVLLLWIYYSSQVFLFGAELTRLCAEFFGNDAPPSEFARNAPEAHPKSQSSDVASS